MKNEMILENGVNVIGTDGGVIRFDDNGRQLHESVFNKAESFMEYFDFMGHEQQRIAKEWYAKRKKKNIKEDKLKWWRSTLFNILDEASEKTAEEYYIANIEPSIDENGRIYYKAGEKVARGLSSNNWRQKAREFAPECESDLSTLYQLVLWYAYRIARGYWTVEYVCDDSSSAGNYCNFPNATHNFEVSGAREVGGASDGVGNTYKIVTSVEPVFCYFGGSYDKYGDYFPVANVDTINNPDSSIFFGSGVVVLNKVQTTSHG